MTEETTTSNRKPQASGSVPQVNHQPTSTSILVLIAVYMILLSVLLIYSLLVIWPANPAEASTTAKSSVTRFLFWDIFINEEVRLILIVFIAGGLGSLVHAFRSYFWYVGHKAFVSSWAMMYFLLPFIGSSLSLLFFFVLRGGLFSPQATVQATSPYGFAGVAGLVGLFSNQAALKLKEVAESFFSTRESTRGADTVTEGKTSDSGKDKQG